MAVRFPQAVAPTEWGAAVNYDRTNWQPWRPDKWVIHYGGNAVRGADDGVPREIAVLKAWEHYHIRSKGWMGIAYNYAIGQSGVLYRLRGEQRSGATSGDADRDGIPENHEARAVVFILGGDQKPSTAALDRFRSMWASDPMPVIGHRDSSLTTCPGDHLYAWIKARGYESMTLDRYDVLDNGDPILKKDFDHKVKQGVFTENTKPGQVVVVDRLAAWMNRQESKVIKQMIATAVASVTAAKVDWGNLVDEIGRRLLNG